MILHVMSVLKMRTAEIDLKYSQDTTLMKQKIFIQQKEE